jgi:hypothetical protein
MCHLIYPRLAVQALVSFLIVLRCWETGQCYVDLFFLFVLAESILNAPEVTIFLPTGGAIWRTTLLEAEHVFRMFAVIRYTELWCKRLQATFLWSILSGDDWRTSGIVTNSSRARWVSIEAILDVLLHDLRPFLASLS